jgi:hypothetical protein
MIFGFVIMFELFSLILLKTLIIGCDGQVKSTGGNIGLGSNRNAKIRSKRN